MKSATPPPPSAGCRNCKRRPNRALDSMQKVFANPSVARVFLGVSLWVLSFAALCNRRRLPNSHWVSQFASLPVHAPHRSKSLCQFESAASHPAGERNAATADCVHRSAVWPEQIIFKTTAGHSPILPVIIRLTMAEGSHLKTESPRTSEPSKGLLLSSKEKPSSRARSSTVLNRRPQKSR